MKKITEDALNAFNEGSPFRRTNTEVFSTMKGAVVMRLHGNMVAVRIGSSVYVSLAGWDTRTTRERVNALLPPECKIHGTWYSPLSGSLAVSDSSWYALSGKTLVKVASPARIKEMIW